MAKIYTIGELLVEIMREGKDQPLNRPGPFLGPYPSGAPAIFISAAAQLGHQAKIWGGVGQDKFGEVLLTRLKADGVDCSDVAVSTEGSTAVAFIAYSSSGEREFIYHIGNTPAALINFDSDAERKKAAQPDYFHVMGTSITASDHMHRQIDRAVKCYYEMGSKISFDPNIRPELLRGKSIEEFTEIIMDRCSVFLPGSSELFLFSSKKDIPGCADDLFERYPQLEIIAVKLGSKGAIVFTRDQKITVPVYPIERVRNILDPTGAGDVYDAAFLCGLLEGKSIENSAHYAAKAGAINSTAFGPMGGDMREIDTDFLQEA
jgi:tagatose kinase